MKISEILKHDFSRAATVEPATVATDNAHGQTGPNGPAVATAATVAVAACPDTIKSIATIATVAGVTPSKSLLTVATVANVSVASANNIESNAPCCSESWLEFVRQCKAQGIHEETLCQSFSSTDKQIIANESTDQLGAYVETTRTMFEWKALPALDQ